MCRRKWDAKQAEELLMKFQENMTGISEEKKKMAVWCMNVDGGEEKGRAAGK